MEFVGGIVAVFFIFLWFFVGVHHQYLFPPIKQEKFSEHVEFIANVLGVTITGKHPFPAIYFCDQQEMVELIPIEDRWEFIVNDTKIWGLYFKNWNRIFFDRQAREDIQVHEAAHFVLRTYGIVFEDGDKEDELVWKITRFFLLVRYPARYMFVMMFYGIFGVWGYDAMKHSMVESPA